MRWFSLLCIAVLSSWGLKVTIDNVDPTSAELENGSIWLRITWRADSRDTSFRFALKKPGVDDFPIAFMKPIDSTSSALGFEFESVSPGNYSLVAWSNDVSNNGVTLGTFSAMIEARNPSISLTTSEPTSVFDDPITSSPNPTSNSNIPIPEPTSTSNNPISNPQESTSKPNHSLIIGAIVGPVFFIASIVVVGVYSLRKRRESMDRTVLRPFDAPCVAKTHRKIQLNELPQNTNDDSTAVAVTEAIRSPPRTRRHNDSGWRPGPPPSEVDSGNGRNVLDLPPEYEHAL
ncbi:hypothetical protein VNI00_008858 [Paramarasmius palmivorus]|uniref:Uncharacterized protein n=1 Tax=Paramarasmius palmivorus TaxID=297713 RepID=A0AAW0CTU3_9AGAR